MSNDHMGLCFMQNFSQKIDIGSNLEIQCIYYWPKQQHDLPISKKNPDFGWQILL